MLRALIWVGVCCFACSGAPVREEAVRLIPLDVMSSTNGQKGPRRMTADFFLGEGGSEKYIEPYGLFLQQIRREFRGGASNVILVRGKDITQAVKAAALAFVRGRSANGPVNPEGET